jgi:hypothetical protein
MAGRGLQVVADSDTLDHLGQRSMTKGKELPILVSLPT